MGGTAAHVQSVPGNSGENPLFFQAIMLFVIGVLVIGLGIFFAASAAKEKGLIPTSLEDAAAKQQAAQAAVGQVSQDAAAAKGAAAGAKPTGVPDLADVAAKKKALEEKAAQYKESAKQAAAFILPVLTIVLGALTGACGFFVLKKANWARYGGFASVCLVLGYFTYLFSVKNANGEADFSMGLPLLLCLVSALAAKLMFDLHVEKFQPAR